MSGAEHGFQDLLGELFLRDVGLGPRHEVTPAAMEDDEFGRTAVGMGLLDAEELASARAALADRPDARLWEVLEERSVLDVGDVLEVLGFGSDLQVVSSRSIGRYFVVERIGEGGSGRVYRAIHKDLLKHVALKVLTERPEMSRSRLQRFHREATTAAGLKHPNIVGVHDVGVEGDLHYIAMDLVEGVTLSAWLAGHRSMRERLELFEQVVEAIGHAHRHGVLHRDLKPQNVLVGPDDEPVVVDFGLARLLDDETLTQDGAVLGTPSYMAPEQIRGEVRLLDARADLYSLGVILYEMVTGRLPFAGGTPVEVYQRMAEGSPRFPSAVRSRAPVDVETMCLKCLDPLPDYRYASAEELLADVRRCLSGEPVRATRLAGIARVWRRIRRRPALSVALALLFLVVVSGALVAERLMSQNEVLARSGEIKSSYSLLRTRLEPILIEAEELRHGEPDEARRSRLVARADEVIAGVGDRTGVGAAYSAWARWLVRHPEAEAALDAARTEHPENPFPYLVSAWRWVRLYAEAADWPLSEGFNLFTVHDPFRTLAPRETPRMRVWLAAAQADVDAARSTRLWQQVPELRWVEELCEGYGSYAAGDFAGAVERLEGVGAWADLTLEPVLLLAFAYFCAEDLDGAFATVERLLDRRPGLVPLVGALAACHRHRGAELLAARGDAAPDLLEARRLHLEVSSHPAHDGELGTLDLLIGVALSRSGGDAVERYRAALATFDAVLEDEPENYQLLVNRALCLMLLAESEGRPGAYAGRSLQDVERASRIAPDDPTVAIALLGEQYQALKRRLKAGELAKTHLGEHLAEIDEYERRFGAWSASLYYRAGLSILGGDLAKRMGEDPVPLYEEGIAVLEHALELEPEFQEARTVRAFAVLFAPARDPHPVQRILECAQELLAQKSGAGRPNPLEDAVAERLDALALEREGTSDGALLLAAIDTHWSRRVTARPDDASLRAGRARALLRGSSGHGEGARERLLDAIFELERATAGAPPVADEWCWLSLAWKLLGDLGGGGGRAPDACAQRARECAQEALALEPTSPDALALHAAALLDLGDQDAAWADLREALTLEPQARPSHELLGHLNLTSWRMTARPAPDVASWERAVGAALVAVAFEPRNGSYLNTLGVARYRAGQFAAAAETLEMSDAINARESDGGHPADVAFRAMAAHRLGDLAGARGGLDRLRALMERPEFRSDVECRAFLSEAEEIIPALLAALGE